MRKKNMKVKKIYSYATGCDMLELVISPQHLHCSLTEPDLPMVKYQAILCIHLPDILASGEPGETPD
jgi:hypothetical protein